MGLNPIPKTGHRVRYFAAFHKACRIMPLLYPKSGTSPSFPFSIYNPFQTTINAECIQGFNTYRKVVTILFGYKSSQ
jgi:hypothetical protein